MLGLAVRHILTECMCQHLEVPNYPHWFYTRDSNAIEISPCRIGKVATREGSSQAQGVEQTSKIERTLGNDFKLANHLLTSAYLYAQIKKIELFPRWQKMAS